MARKFNKEIGQALALVKYHDPRKLDCAEKFFKDTSVMRLVEDYGLGIAIKLAEIICSKGLEAANTAKKIYMNQKVQDVIKKYEGIARIAVIGGIGSIAEACEENLCERIVCIYLNKNIKKAINTYAKYGDICLSIAHALVSVAYIYDEKRSSAVAKLYLEKDIKRAIESYAKTNYGLKFAYMIGLIAAKKDKEVKSIAKFLECYADRPSVGISLAENFMLDSLM